MASLLPPSLKPLSRSTSTQPSAGAPPPPVVLRRHHSAPTERAEAAAEQRFTDITLQRLTGAIAEPSSVASEADKTPSALFGEDPPARSTASARPGQCQVCFEDKEATYQLCWNTACEDRYCAECIGRFASEAVSRALYAVPWLKCPGCSSRISTQGWSDHAREARDTYRSNAESLLTFRCQDCHEVGSLLADHQKGMTLEDVISKDDEPDLHEKVQATWADYSYAVSPPETLLGVLAGQDEDILQRVVSCISDIERRTCLQLAILRRSPFIETPCCDQPFCFKCKVGSHHEGETCEERQREELDILCQFCPVCEVPTVRTEGCDHIVCVCGEDWTWQELPEAGQALGPVRFLREALANGSLDANWCDENGRSCLMYAAMEGRADSMEALIEAGANVNDADHDSRSVMLHAFGAVSGSYNSEAVDLLVRHNVSVDKEGVFQWIRMAGGSVLGFTRILELSQTPIDAVAQNDQTILSACLRHGRWGVVAKLLEMGVNVDQRAPTQFCTTINFTSDVALFDRIFDASGMEPDQLSTVLDGDKSLVQGLVDGRRREMLRHIISTRHAKLRFRDVVRTSGHWDPADLIPTPLFDVMIAEGSDVWEVACADAADDSSRGWFLEMVLACPYMGPEARGTSTQRNNVYEFASALLRYWNQGASAFCKTPKAGELLVLAAKQRHWPTVKRLITAEVDLEARADGLTTLHCAIKAKNLQIVEQLLEAKADVMTVTQDFKRPLVLAETAAWPEGVALLGRAAEKAAAWAAQSGDGTVDNVGVKLTGTVQCRDCNQKFDTRRAMEIHWKFIHDPSRHQED